MATVEDIKSKFQELTEKRDECKVKKVELETKLRISKEDLQKKMKQLKEVYGLDSIEDADKELTRLESEIASELSECEEFLSQFEV